MDDNFNECPNCGANVFPEMKNCPACGHNMYPQDDESESTAEEIANPKVSSSIGAVVIGWLIACGITLLVHFIVASFESSSTLGLSGGIFLWLAGPIGAIAGSYVAAGISPQAARWIGALIAIFTLPVMVLFTTHWVEVTAEFLLNPWVVACGMITLLGGIFGGWLNYKFSQDMGWKEKWKVRGWEDLLYQELLRKVRFSGSIADRLIEYERQQNPQASRLKLIQSAIERWERDNR
jgi:zinc-ribbon domain